MSALLIFAIVLIAIFLIVTIAMLSLWQFYKEENMIGGLALMWLIIAIFLLVVFFAKNNQNPAGPPATSPGESETQKNP
jgi:hypothetical protein